MSHADRMVRYRSAASALARLDDGQLDQLLDEAPVVSSGIGGQSVLVHVGGIPVFAKRVPLTDLERRPENVMSTANLFHLPTFYQYGVGSTGFGAWRELAAHSTTTGWVIDQECEAFPLMYHWRVLAGPSPPMPTPDEWGDPECSVAYWDGSAAVGERLGALYESSASLMLFLEYIPQNLHEWLTSQRLDDPGAVAMVERHLRSDVAFMNANGLIHFDAHFRNVLTDGQRLFFADFGLASSSRFELSEDETTFFATNIGHDACYTVTELVNWLVRALVGADGREEFIRRWARGGDPGNIAAPAATIIGRYAPIAVVMNDFYRKLHYESRTTPYPIDEIQGILSSTSSDTY